MTSASIADKVAVGHPAEVPAAAIFAAAAGFMPSMVATCLVVKSPVGSISIRRCCFYRVCTTGKVTDVMASFLSTKPPTSEYFTPMLFRLVAVKLETTLTLSHFAVLPCFSWSKVFILTWAKSFSAAAGSTPWRKGRMYEQNHCYEHSSPFRANSPW